MWQEMCSPRAPENSRTGMEINPNVKYPDHTEEAISRPLRQRPIFDWPAWCAARNGNLPPWKSGQHMIRRFDEVRQGLFVKHL